MTKQTVQEPIGVNTNPEFDRLPWGYTLVSVYDLTCDVCGSDFKERIYINPDKWMITERKPCLCMMNDVYKQLELKRQQEAKDKLCSQVRYYFQNYDMLRSQGFSHMSFSTYKSENQSHQIALKALKNFKTCENSIILHGLQGRGKTHLGVSCARDQQAKGFVVLALKCVDLLNRIKITYRMDREAESDILDIMKDVDLLLIDDIGTENPTDWVLEKLYMVIDYRVEHKKSMIFTTNLDGQEMVKRLGGALTSRIWGAGGLSGQYEIDGRDWRVS